MEDFLITNPKQNKKTVLVSGGCGFIGSAFLRKYVPLSPEVFFVNIDDMRAGSNKKSVSGLIKYDNYRFHKIAIEDVTQLETVFNSYPITDIIHFAADSDVDHSIKYPLYTANVNITGTLLLLEAARKIENFNRFVYVSTDEVFGDVEKSGKPKKEDAKHKPSNPYSASKSAAEGFVLAYHKTYGLNVVITRGANTFGPWQDYTKLIPVAIKALREKKKIPLYGDGKQEREWLPVNLHIEGIKVAWVCGKSGESYNISTGIFYPNIELIQILIAAVDAPIDSYKFVKDRPGHDFKYSINSDKIQRLCWPQHKGDITRSHVDEALIQTALWYYKKNE